MQERSLGGDACRDAVDSHFDGAKAGKEMPSAGGVFRPSSSIGDEVDAPQIGSGG